MMSDFRESLSGLQKQIEALEGAKQASAARLATQNINALRTFVDAAIGWFHQPDDEETIAGGSHELEITCPKCGEKIKFIQPKSK